jgi:hypothetical protein
MVDNVRLIVKEGQAVHASNQPSSSTSNLGNIDWLAIAYAL